MGRYEVKQASSGSYWVVDAIIGDNHPKVVIVTRHFWSPTKAKLLADIIRDTMNRDPT